MHTQLSLKPAGGLPASKKEETEEVGDDTTWGGGGSVHQPKCLSYTQVYGPTADQRESGEEWLWADFNHAGPKGPDIHPAPGGDRQVSRESPRESLRPALWPSTGRGTQDSAWARMGFPEPVQR